MLNLASSFFWIGLRFTCSFHYIFMRQNERTILLKKINVQSSNKKQDSYCYWHRLREKCPDKEFFLVRISPGKYGPEKTPYLDTFHTLIDFIHSYCSDVYVADFNLLNAKVTITWKPFTWLALQINRLVSL